MSLLRARGVATLAVYLALYHLYIGIYGSPTNRVFLPVHLCLALALCFLAHPVRSAGRIGTVADWGGALASLALLAWCLLDIDEWDLKSVGLSPLDHAACTLILLLVS